MMDINHFLSRSTDNQANGVNDSGGGSCNDIALIVGEMGDGPTPTNSYNESDDNELARGLEDKVECLKKVDSFSIGIVDRKVQQAIKVCESQNTKPCKDSDLRLVTRTHYRPGHGQRKPDYHYYPHDYENDIPEEHLFILTKVTAIIEHREFKLNTLFLVMSCS